MISAVTTPKSIAFADMHANAMPKRAGCVATLRRKHAFFFCILDSSVVAIAFAGGDLRMNLREEPHKFETMTDLTKRQ